MRRLATCNGYWWYPKFEWCSINTQLAKRRPNQGPGRGESWTALWSIAVRRAWWSHTSAVCLVLQPSAIWGWLDKVLSPSLSLAPKNALLIGEKGLIVYSTVDVFAHDSKASGNNNHVQLNLRGKEEDQFFRKTSGAVLPNLWMKWERNQEWELHLSGTLGQLTSIWPCYHEDVSFLTLAFQSLLLWTVAKYCNHWVWMWIDLHCLQYGKW